MQNSKSPWRVFKVKLPPIGGRISPEQATAASLKWASAHRDIKNAATTRYNARKSQQCPTWLSTEQHAAMLSFYTRCKKLNVGITHRAAMYTVDHIVPLHGTHVSGLHVPWNLQILTHAENASKGNRYEDLQSL